MNVDVIALERARKALQNRFDAEAYIVMVLAEMRTGQDRVPESTIDENIGGMGDEFVRYMNAKANYRNGKIKKEELLSHLELNCIILVTASRKKKKLKLNIKTSIAIFKRLLFFLKNSIFKQKIS